MQRWITALAALLLISGCGGCASPGAGGGRHGLDITVEPSGRLRIDAATVDEAELVARVKAAGATPATAITIHVAAGTPQAVMRRLTATLRRGGFAKVMFTRPPRASATVVAP